MRSRIFFLTLFYVEAAYAQNFWEPVAPSAAYVFTLAANSQGNIFATSWTSGVYRSTDAGTTWVQVNSGFSFPSALALAVNPLNDDLFASSGNRVYRSTTNGDVWDLQDSTTFYSGPSRLALNKQGSVFASTDTLRRSTDNGLTWTIVHNGLLYGSMQDLRIHSNGDIYVARKGDWLFRSTNNGVNWTALPRPIGLPFFDADAIAFGPGGEIYVGDDGDGFFKSTDGGSSWAQLNSGLPNTYVWALAVTKRGYIFAGMANGGIYRSTNGGAQWDSVNTGLGSQSRRIYSLLVAPSGYLITGTINGLYRSTQPITSVDDETGNILTQYDLFQNYPNPFNPSTTIRFNLPVKSRVRLLIFNLLGQQVAELINEEVSAGSIRKVWTAGVASGFYFYKVEAVSVSDPNRRFVDVKKMILLK